MKGQILADFLIEKPDEAPPDNSVVETPQEPWTLFTDGSSCVDGSGAGLILTSPEGTKFTYVLRFQFIASNNEAKYEALIASLRIAAQIGVHNLHVSVDSKLVVNQVLGTYIAKEENMVKYLEKAKNLISGFVEYLRDETLPDDRKEASKLRIKARQYELVEEPVGLLIGLPWDGGGGGSLLSGEGKQRFWIEELPHVLWAYRTMIKSSHGDTPFSLTYGTEAVIPAEIDMPTYRTAAVDAVHNNEGLRLNLDLLEERRKRAAIRKAKAKLKMSKYYNAIVRGVAFRPEDFVYRSNEASHAMDGGKLGPKWEGPYEVTEAQGEELYMDRDLLEGNVLTLSADVEHRQSQEMLSLSYGMDKFVP
ncbi:reverse transcriptase domain-containing protein [Tanacetum coccineum]|uniref:Reverse transcriptase domain-containing protein n=1 Tax=Tanacetum coccineum TaxID=301880 RepID=A0ABQ4WRP5_9ASTR